MQITVDESNVRVNALTGGITQYHSCFVDLVLVKEIKPTCTTDGFYVFVCAACGENEIKLKASELDLLDPHYSIDRHDALGHDYSECIHTAATCTEIGYDTYLCKNGCFTTTVMKYDDKNEPLYPALGHETEEQIILPVCDPSSPGNAGLAGFVINKCNKCSYTSRAETIPFDFNDPSHHPGSYIIRVIENSADNNRITEWACPGCSNVFEVTD